MTTSFLIGNLLGRVAASYLIVLFILSLAGKLNWRSALKRSLHWYGIASTLLLTMLGMVVAISRSGSV